MKLDLPDLKQLNCESTDVAKYFLYRANIDGDLISPLRMQKLVYYAYAWVMVRNQAKLFSEDVQAWVNGPVIHSLYKALKDYGNGPIEMSFLGELTSSEAFRKWFDNTFSEDIQETLSLVYRRYMAFTPFELVTLTHREQPWKVARQGLGVTDHSSREISDAEIYREYASQLS